jgi:hypothetical protein
MKTNPTIFIADDDDEDINLLRDSITERNCDGHLHDLSQWAGSVELFEK